jgi:hypothetical protein
MLIFILISYGQLFSGLGNFASQNVGNFLIKNFAAFFILGPEFVGQ